MTLASGFGGAVALADTHGGTADTIDAFIKSWSMEDVAQLHDVSVMGSGVVGRSFLKGLETVSVTCEFVADSDMEIDAYAPGSALGAVTLDATGTAVGANQYVFAGAIVESMGMVKDVDGMTRGTLRFRGNQAATITRPDSDV